MLFISSCQFTLLLLKCKIAVLITCNLTTEYKKMENCEKCEDIQQQLLADGGCHEIECNHHHNDNAFTLEDEEDSETVVSTAEAAAAAAAVDTNLVVASSSSSSDNDRKRKFPTLQRFADAEGDKMKRKVAPIRKWVSLPIRKLFLVKKVISMEVVIKKQTKEGFYAELEDEEGLMINGWISDIIRKELGKYPLEEGNTYIMPLGPEQSRETGYTYNNFAVQTIKDD